MQLKYILSKLWVPGTLRNCGHGKSKYLLVPEKYIPYAGKKSTYYG